MVTKRHTECLNCAAQNRKCVCVEGIELVFLACDSWFWAVTCGSAWLCTGQDMFLISAEFLLRFVELCTWK